MTKRRVKGDGSVSRRVVYEVGSDAKCFTLYEVDFCEDNSAGFDLGILMPRAYSTASASASAEP